ncbi:MAG: hypothetical protein LBE20_06495 [Deltaproteobacteria bacterium]|jgi:hypothetical protein|nr:hypothetical protein [Deltaproteobacteria bacterium]
MLNNQYPSEENQQVRRNLNSSYPHLSESETLKISSSYVVIIDQFMLSNQQFLSRLPEDANNIDKVKQAVADFGGACFEIENGTFDVSRDIYQKAIVASQILATVPTNPAPAVQKPTTTQAKTTTFSIDDIALRSDELFAVGKVFVDTKCMVLCDVNALFNQRLLEEYSKLRAANKDKPARDLLRKHGCAVRYGFLPQGDELGIHITREKTAIVFF